MNEIDFVLIMVSAVCVILFPILVILSPFLVAIYTLNKFVNKVIELL